MRRQWSGAGGDDNWNVFVGEISYQLTRSSLLVLNLEASLILHLFCFSMRHRGPWLSAVIPVLERHWLIGVKRFSTAFRQKVSPRRRQPLLRLGTLVFWHKEEHAFAPAPQLGEVCISQENMGSGRIVRSRLVVIFPAVPDQQVAM